MRYFKVKTGFDAAAYVSIDETEVDKAFLAFLTDAKTILGGVPVRGRDIITVSEDWHREMGWNPHHALDGEDWAYLRDRGVVSRYTGALGEAKERVTYLINSNQTHLVGTPKATEVLRLAGLTSSLTHELAAAKRV